MGPRIVIYVLITFFPGLIYNSIYPQTKTRQDSTAKSSSKNLDLNIKIKKIIDRHFSKQSNIKLPLKQKEDSLKNIETLKKEKKLVKPDTVNLDIVEEKLPPLDTVKKISTIIINNDEIYTRSHKVKLTFSTPPSIGMKVSNFEDFQLEDGWMPVTSELKWTLLKDNGSKKVFFKLLYPDSSESPVYNDEIILDMTPPIAEFTIKPDSGIAGETVFTFNAAESFHDFDLFLRWDWEDDGQYDTFWNISKKETHKFAEGGGKKKIKLEVKDSGGWHVTKVKEVIVFSRPQPSFEFSQNFQNPLQFTFDASSSFDYDDGKNILVRWNFNYDDDSNWDTEWSADKRIKFTYTDFEYKIVALEVKDSKGIKNVLTKTIENEFHNMALVPSGNFPMGSSSFDIDERPVHTVFVNDFWIDKYPVTNQQYAVFLNSIKGDTKIDELINLNSPDFKIHVTDSVFAADKGFEDHPVVQVSWFGAQSYARYYGKSLPTEAEWEKAARGTDGRLYPWGNKISNECANFWDSGDPFDNNTTPVGFFNGKNNKDFQTINSTSPYKVYDLVGNVREWCNDWYQRNYYSVTPLSEPKGPDSGTKRVIRGGGYLFRKNTLRTTYRSSYDPFTTNSLVGFRCVKRNEEAAK